MKYIYLDQKEFGSDSEESMSLASSHEKEFSDITAFVEETAKCELFKEYGSPGVELEVKYLSQLQYSSFLIVAMDEHYGINLLSNCEIIVIHEAWDVHDYILKNTHNFYRVSWHTTA